MITVDITPEQIQRATDHYSFKELRGSITKGKGNLAGALGEIIVYDYFSSFYKVEFADCYDYDLILNGAKVDVKTKLTTAIPAGHYLCGIPDFNTHQQCDYYLFARIFKDMSKGFLLGQITPTEFYQKAVFRKKGEVDINGWLFKGDCYNLEISELTAFRNEVKTG